MEEKTVSVVNGRFSVEMLEAGSGPDLLFIHGAGGLMWDPFLEQLSQHYHVIAPKIPGTAGSTGIEWLMDHHDVFYFYWDFLDALGVDDVIVVGHSMGGWFAAEVAAMQPSRVSKLVLIAPIGLWNDDYPVKDFFAMMPHELVADVFHDQEHPGAKMMTAPPPEDPDELRAATVERAKMLHDRGAVLVADSRQAALGAHPPHLLADADLLGRVGRAGPDRLRGRFQQGDRGQQGRALRGLRPHAACRGARGVAAGSRRVPPRLAGRRGRPRYRCRSDGAAAVLPRRLPSLRAA